MLLVISSRKAESESKMDVDEAPSSSSTSQVGQQPTATLSEIERLEATLRILNSSLQTGRSDSLVDQLLTENGTLRNDVEMADLTAAASRPYQPPQVDFSNFKFPEKKIEVPYDTADSDRIVEEIKEDPPQDRHVLYFERILSEEKRKELEQIDDEIYEPTLRDIKVLQQDLSSQV